MSGNRIPRTGAHVTAAPSGCGGCGHPFTLHSNGRTGCKAAGCTGGATATCLSCNGTTTSLLTGRDCTGCEGRGTVSAPCPGFTAGARAHQVPELLAS